MKKLTTRLGNLENLEISRNFEETVKVMEFMNFFGVREKFETIFLSSEIIKNKLWLGESGIIFTTGHDEPLGIFLYFLGIFEPLWYKPLVLSVT